MESLAPLPVPEPPPAPLLPAGFSPFLGAVAPSLTLFFLVLGALLRPARNRSKDSLKTTSVSCIECGQRRRQMLYVMT